jgi:hypothetical protein
MKATQAVKATIVTLAALFFAGQVFAGSMSIKIEQPKSPTNLNNLNINFVVLDYASKGAITATCSYNKDGGAVSQFGGDIAIDEGGGTANCTTNSSIMNGDGTYKFIISATNGAPESVSGDVTVVYNTSGPDTPTSYSKEDFESCKYKIKYHTGDNGNTAKVELYRSANTTFDVNAGSLVAIQNIGPDTDGEFITDKPDCSKTYYFVVRAFDSSGNGSGVRGDSETHTVTTTTTTTTTGGSAAAGAIPAGTGGNVLGALNGTLEGSTGASGAVLGEASLSGTPTPTAATPTPTQKPGLFTGRNIGIGGGLVAVLLLLLFLFK